MFQRHFLPNKQPDLCSFFPKSGDFRRNWGNCPLDDICSHSLQIIGRRGIASQLRGGGGGQRVAFYQVKICQEKRVFSLPDHPACLFKQRSAAQCVPCRQSSVQPPLSSSQRGSSQEINIQVASFPPLLHTLKRLFQFCVHSIPSASSTSDHFL